MLLKKTPDFSSLKNVYVSVLLNVAIMNVLILTIKKIGFINHHNKSYTNMKIQCWYSVLSLLGAKIEKKDFFRQNNILRKDIVIVMVYK